MAHSSICTLNPIMQTEILKVVDWQGEAKKAFNVNPSREHSMYVCGELADRLRYLSTARKALMACLNGNLADSEGNRLGDSVEKEVLELLDTGKGKDRVLLGAFERSFEDKRKTREKNPDSAISGYSGLVGYVTPLWISTLLPFSLLSDENDPRVRYTKASNKVYRFIENLGEPSTDTVKEFMRDITHYRETSASPEYHLFEHHLEIAGELDSGTEKIFIDFYVGTVYSVVFVRCKSYRKGLQAGFDIMFTSDLTVNGNGSSIVDSAQINNKDGAKFHKFFMFMVNAWLAERTCLVKKTKEPMSVRNATINAAGFAGMADPDKFSARYRYIQVTDEAWTKHKEADAVFRQHSGDCNYKKAFWFRKSHFAQRNGNIYLVSAHWCHRTCSEVNPGPERHEVEILV